MSYKDLLVWQRSLDLVQVIYDIARRFPDDERFALAQQIRRAAISIPSNIAEGYSRDSRPDYVRMPWVKHGSSAEVETQLTLARRLGLRRCTIV